MNVRLAILQDCKAILDIYQYYVLNTAITFEYEVPTLQEMEGRMKSIQAKYPYLVAEMDGKVLGYAYAADFRHKAAYQWSAESSIYVHQDYRGQGVGKLLYQYLIHLLRLQGYYNVFGGVALPNDASLALHQKLGFQEIGVYENIGYKHGRWHSTKWFQLVLQTHSLDPAKPKSVEEINPKLPESSTTS